MFYQLNIATDDVNVGHNNVINTTEFRNNGN